MANTRPGPRNTGRQLVMFYARPTLYEALRERAYRLDQDFDYVLVEILEQALLPRRLPRRAGAHLRALLTNETPATPAKDAAGARGTNGARVES